jgi:hypothetical protein
LYNLELSCKIEFVRYISRKNHPVYGRFVDAPFDALTGGTCSMPRISISRALQIQPKPHVRCLASGTDDLLRQYAFRQVKEETHAVHYVRTRRALQDYRFLSFQRPERAAFLGCEGDSQVLVEKAEAVPFYPVPLREKRSWTGFYRIIISGGRVVH